MNKPAIGLDIDGTITNPYGLLPLFNKLSGKNLTKEDWTQYDMAEIYGLDLDWNMSEENPFSKQFFDSCEIRLLVSDIINEMSNRLDIHFITARVDNPYSRMRTEQFLKENRLGDYPLHMLGSHNKVDKCKELGVKLMIEDSLKNAIELVESGINVILLSTNYNQHKRFFKGLYKRNNWTEILNDYLDTYDSEG